MNTGSQYTGIILAGGQSTRFGSDKGLTEVQGKKMIEYALATLLPFCCEIIISSNNKEYRQFPYRIVPDMKPGYGPLMGIYSSLSSSSTSGNLVLAVDNILVTPAFYHYLLSKDMTNYRIAVPYLQNKFYEPLVGCYTTDCLEPMEKMMREDNYKLPDLLSRCNVLKLMVEEDFPAFHPFYFQSLNYPQDLLFLKGLH
jgi:molybdenum cofactor guanylyltransferase